MAVQIGIDPATGEPIYAPVDPSTIPGFDASGRAIPNYPSQPVGGNIVPQAPTLNTVISEAPLTPEQQAAANTAIIKNNYQVTPQIIQTAIRQNPAPKPEVYKPGSTMYELGFSTSDEYKGTAQRIGRGALYEQRQVEKREKEERAARIMGMGSPTKAPKSDDNLIVIGVKGDTGDLIIKNKKTGELYYRQGTEKQIAEAKKALSGDGRYDKPYEPPSGVSAEKPIAGALAEQPQKNADSLKIYDFRGLAINVKVDDVNKVAKTKGQEQFELSKKIGLVPSEAVFIDYGNGEWGYRLPESKRAIIEQSLQKINASGEEDFNRLVSQGKIPKGAVYSGIGENGNIKYFPPNTVVVVGNKEIISKEDYENLPREWKSIVDTKGMTGLAQVAADGELPLLPDEWWYKGQRIKGEEKEKIIREWRQARENTNILSDEYTKLGNNPELEMTRAVRPDDVARALSTFNRNIQTKVKNSTEVWNVIADKMPDTTEGKITRYTLQELNKAVRTGASFSLILGEAFTVAAPIAITQALANPSRVPEMAKGMVVNTVDSFKTVGNAMIGGESSPEKTGQALASVYLTLNAAKGIISKVSAYVHPKGIPASLIGKEPSTGRVPVGDIDPVALGKAMNKVETAAMQKGGAMSGDIPIEGTPYSLHYLKTPYQKVVGDTLWHGTGDINFVKGTTQITARGVGQGGEAGLYTNPWFASDFASGNNPGIVMVITKASNVNTPSMSALSKLPSQSDWFIEQAQQGLYGSSKAWHGTLETEVVAAPGTQFIVPKPSADLFTRFTVGNTADFFTYVNGKFVPIKIAFDKSLLDSGQIPNMPTATDLYAVKLHSAQNSLQNFYEAVKHPSRTLKDVVGGRANAGVREVYLTTADGKAIEGIANTLTTEAFTRTVAEANRRGIDTRSAAFQSLLNDNLERVYDSKVENLIQEYKVEADKYETPVNRAKFEEIYRVNLEEAFRALAENTAIRTETARDIIRETGVRTPVDTSRDAPRNERPPERSLARPPETRITEVRPPDVRPPDKRQPDEKIRVPLDHERKPDERIRLPDERIYPPDERIKPPEEWQPISYRSSEEIKDKDLQKRLMRPGGKITWKQGIVWWVSQYPYKARKDFYPAKHPPEGAYVAKGIGSAFKTIQLLTGEFPSIRTLDMGIMDIQITNSKGKLYIRYKRDVKQRTAGDITLKGIRTRK